MKFLILLCCIAHLLTEILGRLRLTTPMTRLLRSNDGDASHVIKVAEIIDFINSVYNDNGRKFSRRENYPTAPSDIVFHARLKEMSAEDLMLRRHELPALKAHDKNTEIQKKKLTETVRYHVIDNPEVLKSYSNKQKNKKIENLLYPGSALLDAKSFNTEENKLKHYHKKTEFEVISLNNAFQDLITHEPPYQPSFSDDDEDNQPITEETQQAINETKIKKLRAENIDHSDPPIIQNTTEFKNRTANESQLKSIEKKARTNDTKDVGKIKKKLQSLYSKKEVKVQVEINKEKNKGNKKNETTTADLNKTTMRDATKDPKDNVNKINGTKKNGDGINENDIIVKFKRPNVRSLGNRDITNMSVERFISRKEKKIDRDNREEFSIYSHKENVKISNEKFNERYEKRGEYDEKKKDKDWSYKEKHKNKDDRQRHHKEEGFDKMEYEWNKRHEEYDKNDNWDIKYSEWSKKESSYEKKENDWDKGNDRWDKKHNERNKKDDWDRIDRNKEYERSSKQSEMNVRNDWDMRNQRYRIVDGKNIDSFYINKD